MQRYKIKEKTRYFYGVRRETTGELGTRSMLGTDLKENVDVGQARCARRTLGFNSDGISAGRIRLNRL